MNISWKIDFKRFAHGIIFTYLNKNSTFFILQQNFGRSEYLAYICLLDTSIDSVCTTYWKSLHSFIYQSCMSLYGWYFIWKALYRELSHTWRHKTIVKTQYILMQIYSLSVDNVRNIYSSHSKWIINKNKATWLRNISKTVQCSEVGWRFSAKMLNVSEKKYWKTSPTWLMCQLIRWNVKL